MKAASGVENNLVRLLELVRKLRSPEGCRWDREQTKEDIARYLLEEACEVIDAIENGSAAGLREELGDLLFHIVFLSRMAEERGEFDFAGVMAGIEEKMIRRHPHVFGDRQVGSVAEIRENWDSIKKNEGKGASTYRERFQGITRTLPALVRAQKITKEAAKAGFDWGRTEDVLKKVDEELEELKAAMKTRRSDLVREEMGDLLFSLVNLCRFLEVDAEASLRGAMNKFVRRFSHIEESLLKEGKRPDDATLSEMDILWEKAKFLQLKKD